MTPNEYELLFLTEVDSSFTDEKTKAEFFSDHTELSETLCIVSRLLPENGTVPQLEARKWFNEYVLPLLAKEKVEEATKEGLNG